MPDVGIIGASLVALAMLALAVLVAPRRLRQTAIEAVIPGLPEPFDGYTIAVLSDLHYGSVLRPRRHVARAVQMAHAASPDLVVLLGDYALSHHTLPRLSRALYEWGLRALAPALGSLRARDGVVAVLGNHDYDYDARAVAAWLEQLGASVLVNEARCLERAGTRVAICGLDDAVCGTIDPFAGCASVPPEVPRIVLSHNPDGVLALAPEARADLVLSGHTHGGQVVLPFIGALSTRSTVCGRRSASGWIPGSRAPLYVTTGVGVVIPLRVFCRPEVLTVRLRRCGRPGA